jgi:hypothetical protein
MKTHLLIILLLSMFEICFGKTEGNDCSSPIHVVLEDPWQPYTRIDSTCGRGNFADNTCLAYYDGGEDIFFEIEVTMQFIYEFNLDPLGTAWTAMALSVDCPPSGSQSEDCIAFSSSTNGQPHSFIVTLDPGTYYLMIDTWPAPDCIPEFELNIYDVFFDDWGTCWLPISLELPYDSPYSDSSASTCDGWDTYDNTCLGNYDGGKDMIYLLLINRPGNVNIRINPKNTGYTGIALGTACPPPGNSIDDCLAASTSIVAEPHGIELDLEEGEYYLIVDTWPMPDCIPDYDLTIAFALPKICGDVNDDLVVNVSDAVYIINHIFVGGDPPVISHSGDTNCDTYTNISDAVWIINYVFVGGSNPCDTSGDGSPDC